MVFFLLTLVKIAILWFCLYTIKERECNANDEYIFITLLEHIVYAQASVFIWYFSLFR